jgi:hypothetical protein
MTRVARSPRIQRHLVLEIGPIAEARLDACARALGRIAVEKALSELALDSGPTFGETVGTQHKRGPAGATNTDEAKEQVL